MGTSYRLATFLFALVVVLNCRLANAQLAITEAMSSASTNLGPSLVMQNSDYWELTNFGTNTIDLTGYRFDDSDNNLAAADSTPFQGVLIGPGESIVLLQNNVNTNALSVREWWGTNLASSVKILFYSGNGFSSTGDGIRLWAPNAKDASDVIDSVDFGEAVRGSAFVYNPANGEFGALSTNGVGSAFKAATTDDVGSPGRTTGPTPLTIVQQPANVVVNPGDTARFTVSARGRPRGAFQWFFKGVAIEGATGSSLDITNAQSAAAGSYQVKISNGIETVSSATAELVLQSDAKAPVFTSVPSDFEMTTGQGYIFRASATGLPQPAFTWQIGGRDIPGANTSEFSLMGATEQDTGAYSVIARNPLGSVTNNFRITVTQKPLLVITEIMSNASTNVPGHGDWWELTNLGDFPVHLKGYRFDDSSETLGSAFMFTNSLVITPGESIIFAEEMTLDAFRSWWGGENLPANLQFVTYRGNGLSSGGDAVNLWNAAAAEDSDKIASAVFSTATAGVSFGYNPESRQFGELSAAGKFGAFAAHAGGDIGSPGAIRATDRPTAPRFTATARVENGLRLTWSTVSGTNYQLQAKSSLNESAWATVTNVTANGSSWTSDVPLTQGASQKFFRVIVSP